MPSKISVSNIFGDFPNGEALLRHFCAVWGSEEGFFMAWRWLEDGMLMLADCSRADYPEVFAFADSLQDALMQ